MRSWPSRRQEKREGDAIPALSVAVADWGGAVPGARAAPRFPPPWSVDETDACFIVRDHGGPALTYLLLRKS
jgi:hypothetical protein